MRLREEVTRSTTLLVVGTWALCGLASAAMPWLPVPMRIVVGVPLVTFLPGYALLRVALGGGSAFSGIGERVALSVGLSLALVVITGLLLELSPWHLSAQSWLVSLSLLTIVLCVAALVRSRSELPEPSDRSRARVGRIEIAAFSAAGLLAIGALVLAWSGATRQTGAPFTQLWLVPAHATMPVLEIGVENHEATVVTYRLEVLTGTAVVREWGPITLSNGERWTQRFDAPQLVDDDASVTALLYRADLPPDPYRTVFLRGPWEPEPTSIGMPMTRGPTAQAVNLRSVASPRASVVGAE